MLVAAIGRVWPEVAGRALAERSHPVELTGGTLRVGSDSSAHLHELILRVPEILSALSRRFGSAVVAIRPSLERGVRPAGGSEPAPGTPLPPAPLTRAEADRVEELLAPISDVDVAAAVRRVLVKDLRWRRQPPPDRQQRAEPSPSAARTDRGLFSRGQR